MELRLQHDSPVPLYHQLAEALRYRIATGALAAGTTLPPLRQAAAQWGVNLHTVRRAYEALTTSGLAETRVPSGTRVLGRPPAAAAAAAAAARGKPAAGVRRGQARSRRGAAAPSLDELARFIARVVGEASAVHGLTPAALAQLVLGEAAAPPADGAVSVVECSESQARDLSRQLEARWRVRAEPWSLGRRGLPPAGPIVASYFHYNDVRRRWPQRLADVRFAAILPDPRLLDRLAAAPGPRGRGPRRVVVCEREATMADNIAADLAMLLPAERYAVSTRVVRPSSPAVVRRHAGELLLFAPRLWGELDEAQRAQPGALEVRYVFDPVDLQQLGAAFGWSERSRKGASHVA